MRKIVTKKSIYKQVKVGEEEIIKWETSDGKLFEDEESASRHEYFEVKLKRRVLPDYINDAMIIDLYSKDDFESFEREFLSYSDVVHVDHSLLRFPETYVFYTLDESDPDENYGYPDYKTYCITMEEFKERVSIDLKRLS